MKSRPVPSLMVYQSIISIPCLEVDAFVTITKTNKLSKALTYLSHRIAEIQMLLRLRHLSIFESDLRLQTRRLSPSSSSYLFWCSYWLPHYQSLSMSISIRIISDSVRFARKTWALSPASPAPAFLDKVITCRVSMAPLRGMWPRHDVKLHMKMEDIEEG